MSDQPLDEPVHSSIGDAAHGSPEHRVEEPEGEEAQPTREDEDENQDADADAARAAAVRATK